MHLGLDKGIIPQVLHLNACTAVYFSTDYACMSTIEDHPVIADHIAVDCRISLHKAIYLHLGILHELGKQIALYNNPGLSHTNHAFSENQVITGLKHAALANTIYRDGLCSSYSGSGLHTAMYDHIPDKIYISCSHVHITVYFKNRKNNDSILVPFNFTIDSSCICKSIDRLVKAAPHKRWQSLAFLCGNYLAKHINTILACNRLTIVCNRLAFFDHLNRVHTPVIH